MKIIRFILNILFSNSTIYKIDRIKAKKDLLDTTILSNSKITMVYNGDTSIDNILNYNSLLLLLNKVITLLDESNRTIPTSLSLIRLSKTQTVLDLLTINRRVPINYVDILLIILDKYEVLYNLYKSLNIDDVEEAYNSKIVYIYIITMDEIIQSIYDNIKLK